MKGKKTMKLEQGILPGTLTREDIIREHYQAIGRKGAASKSPKLLAARRRNIKIATAVRMAKRRESLKNG